MNVRISSAVGSRDLVDHPALVGADLAHLEHADIEFPGFVHYTPEGRQNGQIGIEIKSHSDFATSCEDQRLLAFDGQAARMLTHYDRAYLVVYGPFTFRSLGDLRIGGHTYRGFNRAKFDNICRSMMNAGLMLHFCKTKNDAAVWIRGTVEWHQAKHHSTFSGSQSRRKWSEKSIPPQFAFVLNDPDRLRFVNLVSQLSRISPYQAVKALFHFESVDSLLVASERDWMEIPGIGKKTASRVVQFLKKNLVKGGE